MLTTYRNDARNFVEKFEKRVAGSAQALAAASENVANAEGTPETPTTEADATGAVSERSRPEARMQRRRKAIIISMLKGMITVRKGGAGRDFKEANVIKVSCCAYDPEEAQLIAQVVVEEFKKYFDATYNNKSEFVRSEIEKHQAALHAEIEEKTRELMEYINGSAGVYVGNEENNPLLTSLIKMSESSVAIDLEIMRWNTRLNNLEDALMGREVEDVPTHELISMLGANDEDPILTLMLNTARGSQDTETLSSEMLVAAAQQRDREEILKLQQDLTTLQSKYADDHRSVVELKERIALRQKEYDEKLAQVTDVAKFGAINYSDFFRGYVSAVRQHVQQLSEEQREIEQYIADHNDDVRRMNEYREGLEARKVALESLKAMHQNFGQSLESLALVSNVNEYELRVAEPSLNYMPVYPSLVKFAFVGFALGFVAGFGLAYLVDVCDATFRSPNEIVRVLRVPILTQLPSFKAALKDATPKKKKEARDARKPTPELLAYYKPNAPVCEVFRQIRTRLFNQKSDGRGRVILNTSPHPSDGKTMFFSNLAVKIAETGKSVILLDCDLRKPDIHKWFGVENKEGVSNVLSGEITLDEALRATPVKNLTVVTAGSRRKNPAELVAGAEFEALLEELRARYDVVLIDSPPILYVSDAASMATQVDGVTYVFRIRRRGRPEVVQG
ncbi:MAG: polysaccharide biosynthesis tyrosine autokinase, partial [Thermoguttaceae bacterium]|nr:polysaccharide biosynthesis tyrosine autokinase [Thermoguttaceae bacterium]